MRGVSCELQTTHEGVVEGVVGPDDGGDNAVGGPARWAGRRWCSVGGEAHRLLTEVRCMAEGGIGRAIGRCLGLVAGRPCLAATARGATWCGGSRPVDERSLPAATSVRLTG